MSLGFRFIFHAGLATVFTCVCAAEGQGSKTERPSLAELARQQKQVRSFLPRLRDPDLKKVEEALEGLVETKSPVATPYIWRLYDTAEGHRRLLAVKALARFKAPGQAERMFQASLADPLLSIRRAAAEGLVEMVGRNATLRRYVKALEDPKELTPTGRFRAVQLIAHTGGEDAASKLRALLKDKDFNVAVAAAEGLGTLGQVDNARFLIEMLGSTRHPELLPAITDALAQLTGKRLGSNLVKWEQWIEDRKEGGEHPPAKEKEPTQSEGIESGYHPDYRNPYRLPVQESPVDFAVVFDTTGSLKNIWPEASAAMMAVIREITKKTPSLRIGGVRYRADSVRRTLSYVIKPMPLTRDHQKGGDFLLDATFGGGSGGLHRGIQHAIKAFTWRANSRKVVLIVGDTTPLNNGLRDCIGVIKEGWEIDRVQFNALYIRSIHGAEHKPTYKALATVGGGRFYEYNKTWRQLVDLTAAKVDPKKTEMPGQTMKKWLTPLPGSLRARLLK